MTLNLTAILVWTTKFTARKNSSTAQQEGRSVIGD